MGHKPIPKSKFKKWLGSRGLIHVRTNGSHEIWDYPDDSLPRPVVIQIHFKDVKAYVVQSNLRTMGISYNDFIKEIQKI